MTKASVFRDQSEDELEANIKDTERELYLLHNDMRYSKKLEKGHLFLLKRRNIARMKTVLKEKRKS